LRIAVCDDNVQEMEQLTGLLEDYAAACKLDLRISCFSEAEDMLEVARSERFTHYFLDVMMPGMDGISAAREIRGFDESAVIVFLTSFKEYAYQSYRVQARDYLLKPVQAEQLFSLLDQLRAQQESEEECISLQNGRSIFRIPLAKLSHIEVNQKRLYFYMTDGRSLCVPGVMSEIESELLIRPDFLKIHRSYIVNLHHISVFSPDGCIMFSGKNLPVSRLLYNQLLQKYMAHLFGSAEV